MDGDGSATAEHGNAVTIEQSLTYVEQIERACAEDGAIVALCALLRKRLEQRNQPKIVSEQEAAARDALLAIRDELRDTTRVACDTLLAHIGASSTPASPVILDPSMGVEGMFITLLEHEPTDTPVDRLIILLLSAKLAINSYERSKSRAELAEAFGIDQRELSSLIESVNSLLNPRGYRTGTKTRWGREGESQGNLRLFITKETGHRRT
jgi:hypothetical protein